MKYWSCILYDEITSNLHSINCTGFNDECIEPVESTFTVVTKVDILFSSFVRMAMQFKNTTHHYHHVSLKFIMLFLHFSISLQYQPTYFSYHVTHSEQILITNVPISILISKLLLMSYQSQKLLMELFLVQLFLSVYCAKLLQVCNHLDFHYDNAFA